MRTLKKTLCLVLAMTMVFGFFGIASAKGASDFPDYDDVQYKEAIDVMTGIDVIDGMGDDPIINPTGKVTRAQAAKMVTYAILGADIAKDLPVGASSFDDVNSYYDWAIPSIEYLADKGIVNGRSGRGGHYDPEGEVTAYEFAKMMLCAAGYGQNGEYKGNSWALNVAIDARSKDVQLFKGSKAGNMNNAATREECALYCFNGLTKTCTVKYSKDTESYDKVLDKDENQITIAKSVYSTLEEVKDGTDTYGRPAVEWKYNNESISAITATPVLTYTESFVPAEAYKALEDEGYTFDKTFATVENGADPKVETSKNFANNTNSKAGNGEVTEFFVDNKGVVSKMVTIKTVFLGIADVDEDDAKTDTDERSINFEIGTKATSDVDGFETVYTVAKTLKDAGKDAGALVVYNGFFNTIAVSLPTYEELNVTSVKETLDGTPVSFVADGKTYEYNSMMADSWFTDNKLTAGNTYTVYFDAYGYAVYAASVEEVSNLGVVVDTGKMSDGFDEVAQVKLLGTDGEVTTLPVLGTYADGKINVGTTAAPKYITENDIVSYKALTGKYEGMYSLTKEMGYAEGSIAITNGKVDFDEYKADAKTMFLVETLDTNDKSTYTAYTGIKAVPSIEKCDGVTVYDAKTDGYADVVFVKNATAKLAATDGVTFIAVDDKPISTIMGTVYDAGLITGPAMTDIKPVQVTEAVAKELKDSNNLLVSAYTENDGVIVGVTPYNGDTTNIRGFGAGVERASNGIITLNTANIGSDATTHTYADDCMVWVIDSSKANVTEKFAAKKPTTITTDNSDLVFWIEDKTSHEVSAIYIIKTSEQELAQIVAQMTAEKAPVGLTTTDMDTQYEEADVNIDGSNIVITNNFADSNAYPEQTPSPAGDANKFYVGILVKAPVEGSVTAIYYNGDTKNDVKDNAKGENGFVKLYLPIAQRDGVDADWTKIAKADGEMTFTFVYDNGVTVTKTVTYEVK